MLRRCVDDHLGTVSIFAGPAGDNPHGIVLQRPLQLARLGAKGCTIVRSEKVSGGSREVENAGLPCSARGLSVRLRPNLIARGHRRRWPDPLSTNAIKYVFPNDKGRLAIDFAKDGDSVMLTIADKWGRAEHLGDEQSIHFSSRHAIHRCVRPSARRDASHRYW